jgi:hypothetical protein
MKNNLLFSCIVVFLFNGVLAQLPELRDHKVISKFEVTSGVWLLKSETGGKSNKSMIGYSFGVGVSHTFSNTFELKGRALYELKGSKTSTHGDGVVDGIPFNTTSTITTDLYYVTLSLMPTFHFTSSKNVLAGTEHFTAL